jgi:hypothetical protein
MRVTDNEKKLLIALVKMVRQYLDRYEDEVDTRAMSAGEHAVRALADFGLMVRINTRFGRWTEAGKRFLEENNALRGTPSPDKPDRWLEHQRASRPRVRIISAAKDGSKNSN